MDIKNFLFINTNPSLLSLIIMAILFLTFFIFFFLSEYGIAILFGMFFTVFVLCDIMLLNSYPDIVQLVHVEKQYNISKDVIKNINSNTHSLIIDNEEIEIIHKSDVKYIGDSKYISKSNIKPKVSSYIIIDKMSFKAPNVWYIKTDSIDNINSKILYYLKEVHY